MTNYLQVLDILRASAALGLRVREGYLGLLWTGSSETANAANALSVF
jgi:hypothetical protein